MIPGLAHDPTFSSAASIDPATRDVTSVNKVPLPQPSTGRDELFTALRNWVEQGQPPSRIDLASADGSVTMPICSYPEKATYNGSGSADRRCLLRLELYDGSDDVDLARLQRELVVVRRRGFALNDQSTEAGLTAVGVAIRNPPRCPVAAVAISMPRVRYHRDRIPTWISALAATVSGIEHDLELQP